MQESCLFLILRKNYHFRWFWKPCIIALLCYSSVQAQRPTQQIKVVEQGTTRDSIQVGDVQVGGFFLEIKSYFEEYSSTQPASVIQLYFQETTKQGDIVVRYLYTHTLLDFHLETTMSYPNKSKQVFEFDHSRRAPLRVALTLYNKQQQLEVDLL